jgi:hypothetical protein
MAEFCGKGCVAICDFCSRFKPDRPFSEEQGECEAGICEVTGKETGRSLGMGCDDFKCFKLE